MDLVTGISAASEAIKLARDLREIDKEIDKAELKLRLVDLVDRLLEAKEALQDAKVAQAELKARIETLERQANQKANLQDENGLLFELDASGEPVGQPFCNHCYVKEERLYRMVARKWDGSTRYDCPDCDFYSFPDRWPMLR